MTQFWITVVLAILTIVIPVVVGVIVYLKQRSRKLISFKIPTQEQLLSVRSELKGKLKIYYESKEVEDVTLFKIEITNSGNREILENDYVEPITISFGQNSRILSSEITDVKPSYFKISATTDEKVITFSKTMINAGESVTLKALVSKPEFYSVHGRIAGGKIEQSIPKTQSANFWWFMAVVLEFIGLGGLVISSLLNQIPIAGFFALIFLVDIGSVLAYAILQVSSFIYSKLHHK